MGEKERKERERGREGGRDRGMGDGMRQKDTQISSEYLL